MIEQVTPSIVRGAWGRRTSPVVTLCNNVGYTHRTRPADPYGRLAGPLRSDDVQQFQLQLNEARRFILEEF